MHGACDKCRLRSALSFNEQGVLFMLRSYEAGEWSCTCEKFKAMGISRDDIIRKFTEFGADTIEFRKAVEMVYED